MENLKQMMRKFQKTERYTFTKNDVACIYYMFNKLYYEPDDIFIFMSQCKVNGQVNIELSKHIAIACEDYQGDVSDYINMFYELVQKVEKTLDIGCSYNDLIYLISWMNHYHKSLIMQACAVSRKYAKHTPLKYANKVLMEWNKKGIYKPEDLQRFNEDKVSVWKDANEDESFINLIKILKETC